MDIYEYLKMDHAKVADLFKLYQTAPSEKNKLEIFGMIREELLLHAESEAKTFYKTIKDNVENESIILHSEDEHDEIKSKIADIERHHHASKEMDEKMVELQDIVDHHVAEEEGRVFKQAKKVLTDKQSYQLKEQMHALKAKLARELLATN